MAASKQKRLKDTNNFDDLNAQAAMLETLTKKYETDDLYNAKAGTVSTGSMALDAILGGGIPLGRITEIYGAEQSGKTTLALEIIAQAQQQAKIESFLKIVKQQTKVDCQGLAEKIYSFMAVKNYHVAEKLNVSLLDIAADVLQTATINKEYIESYTSTLLGTIEANIQQIIAETIKPFVKMRDDAQQKLNKSNSDMEKTGEKNNNIGEYEQTKRMHWRQCIDQASEDIRRIQDALGSKLNTHKRELLQATRSFIIELDLLDWAELNKVGIDWVEIIRGQLEGRYPVQASAFLDLERSFTPSLAMNIGVDLNKIILITPDSAEETFAVMEELCRSAQVKVIVVDSVPALVPKEIQESDMEDAKIGIQARLFSRALPIVTALADTYGVAVVFINQVRTKIGGYHPPGMVAFTTPGGKALLFYSSVRIEMKKVSVVTGSDGQPYAQISRATIQKNKFAPPFRKAEFELTLGGGINKYGELLDIAVNKKVIKQKSSWYYLNDIQLGNGKEKTLENLQNNKEALHMVKNAVKAALMIENI
jgi:recombination protein RecA